MRPSTAKVDVFILVFKLCHFMHKLYVGSTIVLGVMVTATILLPSGLHTVFAVSEKVNVDLVVDTTTLKLQDINNNTQPDAGETAVVLGKLYDKGTQNEIGTYRCSMVWGGWVNSTEGLPVTLGMQVFDMKGNGTIVLIGDEPSMDSIGKSVTSAIGGGTGQFTGITGNSTATAKPIEGTNWPIDMVFNIERPV
jgi:hypothetical protein